MKNALLLAAVALGAAALFGASAQADDKPVKPAPLPRNPGTTDRPGSGSDLKGTTTRGTTMSGTTLSGQTFAGTTMSGTTTRSGSGAAARMTVGTSTPGTPGAARAGAAGDLAGHGKNRYWNESYYGRGNLARGRVVLAAPAGVLVTSAEPAPARSGSGGYVRAPEPAPTVATPVTPTSYVEPAPRGSVYVASGDYVSRTWHGPASGAFAGAHLTRGTFGGYSTYSGYETWGPVGIAGGCDCR